jgi:UDP-3-O-[3-hydroxymyristoyl] glucosamine N-acyltransferase
MPYTLGDIAEKIGAELVGDPTLAIQGLAALTDASAGDLSFLTNKRHLSDMQATQASAVVVGLDFEGEHACALLKVENPDAGFALAADLIGPPDPVLAEGIHSSAVVEEGADVDPTARIGACCVVAAGARIGAGVELWAGCYVGHGSMVGDGSKFHPNVTVREGVTVGQRVILHSGCVIGCDGFGYIQEQGAWKKIRQVGVVVLEDDVEIGANVTIDRARFGKTVIGRGSKIDNLVQIAHNVQLGEHCAFAAQVGLAGSAVVGKNVQMGGQSGAGGHLTIGDYSVVGGRGGVTKDVAPKTFVSGFPAMPHNESRRMHANIARLSTWKVKIRELEKRVQDLESGEST